LQVEIFYIFLLFPALVLFHFFFFQTQPLPYSSTLDDIKQASTSGNNAYSDWMLTWTTATASGPRHHPPHKNTFKIIQRLTKMIQIFYLLCLSVLWIPAHGFSLIPVFKGKADIVHGTEDLHQSSGLQVDNKLGNTVVPTVEPDYLSSTEMTFHPIVKSTFDLASIFHDAPSCESIAFAALVYSCGTIDISNGALIEHVKTVHAARLAICELSNANIKIPHQCSAFLPRPDSYKKIEMRGLATDGRLANTNLLYPKYDAETEAHTQECTAALHSTPQYWTSFSNNKQTGIDICQAVQSGAHLGECKSSSIGIPADSHSR